MTAPGLRPPPPALRRSALRPEPRDSTLMPGRPSLRSRSDGSARAMSRTADAPAAWAARASESDGRESPSEASAACATAAVASPEATANSVGSVRIESAEGTAAPRTPTPGPMHGQRVLMTPLDGDRRFTSAITATVRPRQRCAKPAASGTSLPAAFSSSDRPWSSSALADAAVESRPRAAPSERSTHRFACTSALVRISVLFGCCSGTTAVRLTNCRGPPCRSPSVNEKS